MTDVKDQAQKIAGELGNLLKGGGAADVVSKLGAAGLGDVASSWVGLGKNLPISPSQLESILGNSTVKSIASKLGISTERATHTLSEILPHAIDHMTPDGQAPSAEADEPDAGAIVAKLFG